MRYEVRVSFPGAAAARGSFQMVIGAGRGKLEDNGRDPPRGSDKFLIAGRKRTRARLSYIRAGDPEPNCAYRLSPLSRG